MPEYIDCHTHVNFAAYDEDREDVIQRTLDSNTWMVNVGTQKDTSESAVNLAEQYEKGVYAIVGIHPIHTDTSFHDSDELGDNGKENNSFTPTPVLKDGVSDNSKEKEAAKQGGNDMGNIKTGVSAFNARGFTSRGEAFDEEYYTKLAQHPKVVGIGETGLDYFRAEKESVEKQRESFIKHIELANKLEKPLMLHIRPSKEDTESYKDALALLKQYAKVPGNAHFFAGSTEDAKGFLDLGYSVSFTGVITFTHDYDEVIKYVPLESILSETDAPYVTPTPHRGKRNEPVYVQEVVKRVAEIQGKPFEDVKRVMVENAFRFFGLEV